MFKDIGVVGCSQLDLINDVDWDVLVILDACRFDMFEKVYRGFFGDEILLKTVSPATHTPEFLSRVFGNGGFEDVVYVSANAFCNSKDVCVSKFDFQASRCFKRVVDVWRTGWDDVLGTVHPSEVNKYAVAAMDLYRGCRFVVHYMQPHMPYIFYGGDGPNLREYWDKNVFGNPGDGGVWKWLRDFAFGTFSERTVWFVSWLLGRLPSVGRGRLWLRYGREGFVRGYLEDLRLVLGYVKRLVGCYPGKRFVVTSDHGEFLGERGNFGHSKINRRSRIILEVPWLDVGGVGVS